jgi:hypothetical protein
VKLLWAALRTTNFELHVLEDKAREAKNKLKAKALEVEQVIIGFSYFTHSFNLLSKAEIINYSW